MRKSVLRAMMMGIAVIASYNVVMASDISQEQITQAEQDCIVETTELET